MPSESKPTDAAPEGVAEAESKPADDTAEQAAAAGAAAAAPAVATAAAPASAAASEAAAEPAAKPTSNGSEPEGPKVEGPAPEPVVVAPEYLIPPEPSACFERARQAVKKLHELLDQLEVFKETQSPNSDPEGFIAMARSMQIELLALRAAHKVMAKATDPTRTGETAARKVVDASHTILDMRKFEASACSSACLRNKAFLGPEFHPELTALLPYLDAKYSLEDDADSDGELPQHMEVEQKERSRLQEELQGMQVQQEKDAEALRERQRLSSDLVGKLAAVAKAMAPVSDLLELRPRPAEKAPASASEQAAKELELAVPLRVIFSKFDTLAAFGAQAGVAVRVEEVSDAQPPEKRQKVSSEALPRAAPSRVCVETKGAVLRFSMLPSSSGQKPPLVLVSSEGCGDAVLANLWPQDDGRPLAGLVDASTVKRLGQPYFWAQVMGGLRDFASLLGSSSASSIPESVTAAEVVGRLWKSMPA
mmetsp:Transcript_50747/g.120624  ORF Transcript_50747/g.120624 Transcript_50747/m.120624 type:complete len:479 (+) Transcript_50747:37-1473(+)